MNELHTPHHAHPQPTRKEFWLQCYVAALVNHSPEESALIAEKAVDVCNAYWQTKRPLIPSLQQEHDYPIGYEFS